MYSLVRVRDQEWSGVVIWVVQLPSCEGATGKREGCKYSGHDPWLPAVRQKKGEKGIFNPIYSGKVFKIESLIGSLGLCQTCIYIIRDKQSFPIEEERCTNSVARPNSLAGLVFERNSFVCPILRTTAGHLAIGHPTLQTNHMTHVLVLWLIPNTRLLAVHLQVLGHRWWSIAFSCLGF